jgi:RNase P/RNase MRP subunit POP5
MARNKMSDLRDHIFVALERLNDESISQDELQAEIQKSKQIAQLGSVLVNSAKVEVDYLKLTGKEQSVSDLFISINQVKQINQ